jgi:ubiquinone/menaquinone biosynthesis C-methylase UbiE
MAPLFKEIGLSWITKMTSHEKKVEKFYSHGSGSRSLQGGGFLSFGIWREDTVDYQQAAADLLMMLLENEHPLNRGTILNVACGYGTETFEIYKRLCPENIIAIDITEAHINFARKRAAARNLSQKIVFAKQDACILPYQSGSFSYVIGIEGPAHFNTREKFLRRSFAVLESGGILLLTDIIVKRGNAKRQPINFWIGRRIASLWHMPEANWMTIAEIVKLLEAIGFRVDIARSMGNQVYPGFSSHNTKMPSIVNALKTRRIFSGLGLTIISWLLGWAFRRDMIDYAFIRAVKE